jgi:nitroreductase
METSELSKLIKGRRSIRAWQDKPVPEEILKQAVELATWAPNGGNQQGWRFYIILNKNVINSIADASQSVMSYIFSLPEMAQARPAAPANAARPGGAPPAGAGTRRDALRSAPALIAVAAKKTPLPTEKILAEKAKTDPKVAEMRQSQSIVASRIQSVSAAISYLLLALYQEGIGSIWMTNPMQAKVDLEKILKVPEDFDLIAMVPVGYAAESPTRDRKPVDEVCEIVR